MCCVHALVRPGRQRSCFLPVCENCDAQERHEIDIGRWMCRLAVKCELAVSPYGRADVPCIPSTPGWHQELIAVVVVVCLTRGQTRADYPNNRRRILAPANPNSSNTQRYSAPGSQSNGRPTSSDNPAIHRLLRSLLLIASSCALTCTRAQFISLSLYSFRCSCFRILSEACLASGHGGENPLSSSTHSSPACFSAGRGFFRIGR